MMIFFFQNNVLNEHLSIEKVNKNNKNLPTNAHSFFPIYPFIDKLSDHDVARHLNIVNSLRNHAPMEKYPNDL